MDSSRGKQSLPYFTPQEVLQHCESSDCWVSFLGKVYDLTELCKTYKCSVLLRPILKEAGNDVSHWFDPKTGDVRKYMDPLTESLAYYTPMGRFVHIPPLEPSVKWSPVNTVWWKDSKYLVGNLSKKTRKIRLVNTLTGDEHTLEVCCEETLELILKRYKEFNKHASSYVWKWLGKELDMKKTLEGNGIPDNEKEYDELGMNEDYLPAIFMYFIDDLTVE